MEHVCQGEGCPRRWVCRKADVVMARAFVLDYRRLGDCSEFNDFAMYERGKRTAADLLRMYTGARKAQEDLLNSIEKSLEFLLEEDTSFAAAAAPSPRGEGEKE